MSIQRDIVRFSHKLYAKGFVANHDGNISVKSTGCIWATPTAQSKGDITEQMLVCLNQEGKQISGTHKVFSEINLHLACYRIRDDIQVVVHAHPPAATALACTGKDLEKIFIAESIVTLGDNIPTVPFIPPGCPDTQKVLSRYLLKADVLILANHGVIAVGKTLEQAYYRLELVEHLANIQIHAQNIGSIESLPAQTVNKLLKKRGDGPSELNIRQIVEEELKTLLTN